MAAVSAPQAPSALTPPTSSHGGANSWNYSVPPQTENNSQSKSSDHRKPSISHTNGNASNHQPSRSETSQKGKENVAQSSTSSHLQPARINAITRKDSSISETGSAPDSILDLYGTNRSGVNSVDYGERKVAAKDASDGEDPGWIHRDKLARIESQELQAAGIILPRTRATSKSSRREHSRDQQANGYRSEQDGQKRQRIDEDSPEDEEFHTLDEWDLRMPEEAAEERNEGYQDISGGVKGVSRIPVLKTSPLPIPMGHLERDKVLQRKQSIGRISDEEPISYSKARGRSQSIKVIDDAAATPTPAKRPLPENSPTKKTPAARKAGVSGTRAASAPQKPKAKPAPTRDTNSGQRPPTRSGELGPSNSVKRPEGDPPWLASMYKPDPRLPPDQQLLPTVARRLQQEQWEKEGKFGNTYDTSFRPLNDEELPQRNNPPPPLKLEEPSPILKPSPSSSEWPLKAPKSPAPSVGRPGTAGRAESYSTMPKVTGTPQGVGPLPSPNPIRVQEPPEDAKKKGGCGCCVVM